MFNYKIVTHAEAEVDSNLYVFLDRLKDYTNYTTDYEDTELRFWGYRFNKESLLEGLDVFLDDDASSIEDLAHDMNNDLKKKVFTPVLLIQYAEDLEKSVKGLPENITEILYYSLRPDN